MAFWYLPPPLLSGSFSYLCLLLACRLIDLMVPNIDALTPLVTVVLLFPIRIRLRQMILCHFHTFLFLFSYHFLVQSIIDLY